MSSVGCPRCSETFRIPDASLPEGVQVRCPWCTDIFQIGEIAHHLPPMAELLDADHQPIALGAVSQAFELATASAGAAASAPFLRSPASHDFVDSNATYTEPNFEDTLDEQSIDLQAAKEQAGSRLKWSEKLGWTPDPSAPTQAAELDPLELESEDGESLTFDSDEDHLIEGRDVADPLMALDNSEHFKLEQRAATPYEGFEEYDNDPFEDEDSDADDGAAYELGNQAGIAVTGPVAPRPLSSISGESKVSPSLNAKPRAKKKSSPIKMMIGVVLGGLTAFPLAYGILWAAGKAPSLEGVPFLGDVEKKLAGAPRPINDDGGSSSRNNYEPGRSLAGDMPAGILDSGQEASASDTESTEPATDESPGADDATSIAATEIENDSVAGTAEVTERDMIELPSIPAASELEVPASDIKPATALEPTAESTASTKPSASPAAEPMIELPSIPEPEVVKPEPAKPEPVKPEPVEPEPAKPESVKPEPVKPAPAKPDPDKPETVESGPAKPEPVKPEPTKTTPPTPQLLTALTAAQSALSGLEQATKQNASGDLRSFKVALYKSVTALALAPQSTNQPETTKLLEALSTKGLLQEMTVVGPGWLTSRTRSNAGLLVGGIARELPAGWTMACQGVKGVTDIKLEGVPAGLLKNGDKVVLLGKIEDATAPATVQCVSIQVQKAKSASKP